MDPQKCLPGKLHSIQHFAQMVKVIDQRYHGDFLYVTQLASVALWQLLAGLFHNQRISYETALDMASALGRILVLPGFFKFPHPEVRGSWTFNLWAVAKTWEDGVWSNCRFCIIMDYYDTNDSLIYIKSCMTDYGRYGQSVCYLLWSWDHHSHYRPGCPLQNPLWCHKRLGFFVHEGDLGFPGAQHDPKTDDSAINLL